LWIALHAQASPRGTPQISSKMREVYKKWLFRAKRCNIYETGQDEAKVPFDCLHKVIYEVLIGAIVCVLETRFKDSVTAIRSRNSFSHLLGLFLLCSHVIDNNHAVKLSNETNNACTFCSLCRSKFTAASRGLPATARLCCLKSCVVEQLIRCSKLHVAVVVVFAMQFRLIKKMTKKLTKDQRFQVVRHLQCRNCIGSYNTRRSLEFVIIDSGWPLILYETQRSSLFVGSWDVNLLKRAFIT